MYHQPPALKGSLGNVCLFVCFKLGTLPLPTMQQYNKEEREGGYVMATSSRSVRLRTLLAPQKTGFNPGWTEYIE